MSDADARRHLAESLLAEEVPAKPSPGEFGSPVAWLLGPDLIAALKQFAVYAMWRGELDLHDWMDASPIVVPDPDGDDWWFDYIADIGDGERAMYTTALLCQDDLWIEGTLARPGGAAALPALGPRPDGWTTLPRGPLLVVGGDTAYPLASTSNLEAHVRAPFTWAYRDLVAAGRLTDDDGVPAREVDVVGIPGNHDYFD
ncbi:MAG: hypothetical protein KC464_25530, partial [Myxococcales bacterium]|nr:hypothetical protein [Myxococcales bacterium]